MQQNVPELYVLLNMMQLQCFFDECVSWRETNNQISTKLTKGFIVVDTHSYMYMNDNRSDSYGCTDR